MSSGRVAVAVVLAVVVVVVVGDVHDARRWDLVADDEDEQRVAVSTTMLRVHAVHTRRAASLSRRRYRSEGARAGEGLVARDRSEGEGGGGHK